MKNENLARIARECDVFLLDMDGTVYLGERPIGDMQNTLQKMRGAGKSIVYLTNNSSKAPKNIYANSTACTFGTSATASIPPGWRRRNI